MRLKIENNTGLVSDTKFIDDDTGEPIYGVCKVIVRYEGNGNLVEADLEVELVKHEHEGGEITWTFRNPHDGEKLQIDKIYFRRMGDGKERIGMQYINFVPGFEDNMWFDKGEENADHG